MATKSTPKPLFPILNKMSIGEVQAYPISRLCSVRAACNTVAATSGKQFKTQSNKEEKIITITRTA